MLNFFNEATFTDVFFFDKKINQIVSDFLGYVHFSGFLFDKNFSNPNYYKISIVYAIKNGTINSIQPIGSINPIINS